MRLRQLVEDSRVVCLKKSGRTNCTSRKSNDSEIRRVKRDVKTRLGPRSQTKGCAVVDDCQRMEDFDKEQMTVRCNGG